MTEHGSVIVVADRPNKPLFRSVGAIVYEAEKQEDAARAVRSAVRENPDAALVIVLKHLVEDEDSFRDSLGDVGVPVLILPTRWAKAEPINVDRILAKALGLG